MFDLTISMGNILQIAAMLGGGLYFLFSIKAELIKMSTIQEMFTNRLSILETDIKKLSEVTIEMARQNERMTSQDNRINTITLRLDDLINRANRLTDNKKG